MIENCRRLRLYSKIFNLNVFYCITICASDITLQGKFNSQLSSNCRKLKMKQSINPNGYIEFHKYNLTITLTD